MEESVENDSMSEDSNQESYDNVEAKVMEYCSFKPLYFSS
jgi:hypothetical protein